MGGIFVALFKTVFQPDYVYKADAQLEDVDMVVMIDTSSHNGEVMTQQHQAVTQFTKQLYTAMKQHRYEKLAEVKESTRIKQEEHSGGWIEWLSPKQNDNTVKLKGGALRVATGTFNTETNGTMIMEYNRDLRLQNKTL